MGRLAVCLFAGLLTTVMAPPCEAGQTTPLLPTTRETPGQQSGPRGLFEAPRDVQIATEEWSQRTAGMLNPRDGFFLEMGDMVTGAGWPALGPGFRRRIFGGGAVVRGSAQLSVRLYSAAMLGLELPAQGRPFSLGAKVTYQDSVRLNYFGLGPQTAVEARSGYRLRSTDTLAYGAWTQGRTTVTASAGRLTAVRVGRVAGRDVDYPDVTDQFTEAEAPGLHAQPSFLHADVSLGFHTRDPNAHPTRGGQYEASWAVYSDRARTNQSFSRVELAGTQFFPLATDNIVLALSGWTAMSRTQDGNQVPFYLLPTLGGRTTLRGYRDFRFHDRNLATFSVETRVAIWRYLDAAVFADVGNVGPGVRELWAGPFKSSIGAGVRYHDGPRLIGRAEVAHGREGWQVMFRLIEPLTRSTPLGDRPSVIPFLP
jgi:hypothetical protein